MKITVHVIPRSSQKKIITDGDALKVYVHESAINGKANAAVRMLLAQHFNVQKSRVRIRRGERSRRKVVEIN